MEILENIDITNYTTFRLPVRARYFCVAKTIDDLTAGYQFGKEKSIPVIILGGGSNIIVKETKLDALVVKIEIDGFETTENGDVVLIKAGSGMVWDALVEKTVAMGLSGIEAMSRIPGTVGATPIQNVGAYGQEIKDTLVSLEAYEIATGQVKTFTNAECAFAYRDSIFKHEAKDKYVITSVTLKLSKKPGTMPNYPGVKKYFEERGILTPTLAQIRAAIIAIRAVKLPDPREIASVGSFFKNPFVSKERYESIQSTHSNVVAFPLPDGNYKIGAGWLIDTLGLKGKTFGNLMLYPNNALVIVNTGRATYEELKNTVSQIKNNVHTVFNIELEQEPIEI